MISNIGTTETVQAHIHTRRIFWLREITINVSQVKPLSVNQKRFHFNLWF